MRDLRPELRILHGSRLLMQLELLPLFGVRLYGSHIVADQLLGQLPQGHLVTVMVLYDMQQNQAHLRRLEATSELANVSLIIECQQVELALLEL